MSLVSFLSLGGLWSGLFWVFWHLLGCVVEVIFMVKTIFLALLLAVPTPEPNLEKSVQLIGKSSAAQACPIAPDMAFTAAHVVDPDTLQRWQQGSAYGVTVGWTVREAVDLATIQPKKNFPEHYNIAKEPPKVGDFLWIRGYDFRKKDNAFGPRDFKVEVLRLVAGHIVVKPTVDHGTSGACMLNATGDVVGIVAKGMSTADGGAVAVGVGVWEGIEE